MISLFPATANIHWALSTRTCAFITAGQLIQLYSLQLLRVLANNKVPRETASSRSWVEGARNVSQERLQGTRSLRFVEVGLQKPLRRKRSINTEKLPLKACRGYFTATDRV